MQLVWTWWESGGSWKQLVLQLILKSDSASCLHTALTSSSEDSSSNKVSDDTVRRRLDDFINKVTHKRDSPVIREPPKQPLLGRGYCGGAGCWRPSPSLESPLPSEGRCYSSSVWAPSRVHRCMGFIVGPRQGQRCMTSSSAATRWRAYWRI